MSAENYRKVKKMAQPGSSSNTAMRDKALAQKLEKYAQLIYNLRDSLPAYRAGLWREVDIVANRLSELAGRVKEGQEI